MRPVKWVTGLEEGSESNGLLEWLLLGANQHEVGRRAQIVTYCAWTSVPPVVTTHTLGRAEISNDFIIYENLAHFEGD